MLVFALAGFRAFAQDAQVNPPAPSIAMPQGATGGVTLDSNQQKQVNDIARQVYDKMKADSGGDPDKMQALIKQFMANPQQLFQSMSPDQKKNINSLTQSVMQKQGTPSSNAPAEKKTTEPSSK